MSRREKPFTEGRAWFQLKEGREAKGRRRLPGKVCVAHIVCL